MPGFDRTGPMGSGPMTGGARGLCNPAIAGSVPTYATGYAFGRGEGFRRGRWGGYGPYIGRRGRGYGRGFGWYPPVFPVGYPVNPTDELDFLKTQADELKNSLDEINKRIEALTVKTAEDS